MEHVADTSRQKIRPIETRYKGCRFRSRLEARWAVFFDALGLRWLYEYHGFVLPDGTPYLPDFHLPDIAGTGRWIEIKPYTKDWPDSPVWRSIENISSGEDLDAALELEAKSQLSGFCLLAGEPWYEPNGDGDGEWGYTGYIQGDLDYRFCECHVCGAIGIEFDGRGARIRCGCDHSEHGNGDKCYYLDSPRILRAYRKARSARFEHGEFPETAAGRG